MSLWQKPHTRLKLRGEQDASHGFPIEEYDRFSAGMGSRSGTVESIDIFGSRKTFYWSDITLVAEMTQESLDLIEETIKEESLKGED